MRRTVITGSARTPFGKLGGILKECSAADLGAAALREAMKRSMVMPEEIEFVIMGQVLSAGCGQIPARQAAIKAGIPFSVPADQINKVCASGMRAVVLADTIIRAEDADIIAAGGMESMSNAPFSSAQLRWGHKMFDTVFTDLMVRDGLWCPYYDVHMAVHGGRIALKNGITRQMQDEWAAESQKKASEAVNSGKIKKEIAEICLADGTAVNADETLRPLTTYEALSKLKPLFTNENTVTAGNAPGVNDGASAIMLMSEAAAAKRGIQAEARILEHAECSRDAADIAAVPGYAIQKLLKKSGLAADDIDLFEINEAFAAVTLLSAKIAGIHLNKVNVNGGAIAYGHPLGASGGRIIITLVNELQRRNKRYGIAAICSGMGQGDAVLIENMRY